MTIKHNIFLFVVATIAFFFVIACQNKSHSKEGEKSNFRKTVMVFSPHQDDEANMANAVMYSRAKQGADVYVVIGFGSSTDDNIDKYGLGRLKDSAKNMRCLGLTSSNLIYLGYQCLALLPVIMTNSLGEIIKKDKTVFNTFSHVKEGFPSFHSVKYGHECSQSEENFLSDIVDILLQYKPDEIYAINYDSHPDHIWMGSLVEQALGIVKLQGNYDDYCPRFYQSMSYQSSWGAKKDMMSVFSPNDPKRNILESTLYFTPRNTTFQWNERVRFPVDDRMSVPDVNSNLSTIAYLSSFSVFVDAKRILSVVNGDQIFWERDTRSKSFRATVSVSSNEADKRFLNDFSITRVPFKSICKSKIEHTNLNDAKTMFDLYDYYKWSPEINDTNKIVTLKFKEPLDIDSVRLYDDSRPDNHIKSGLLTFSDGSSLEVGALNNCGSATIIEFNTKKRITFVRFQIKEYIGTPGLSEFEVYAPRRPESPDFIQIYLSAANNQEQKTQSFLYDYPIDVSQQSQTMRLSVYRYPDETPTPNYNWQIEGQHEGIYLETNGILRVEQSTLPGTYTLKVSESETLTDTMTINVINNSINNLSNNTNIVSSTSSISTNSQVNTKDELSDGEEENIPNESKKELVNDTISSNIIETSNIIEAKLFIDIFEVNGGIYSNKLVILNGVPVGLLPCNKDPVRSWQTVSLNLSSEVIKSIILTNTVGIIDSTEDAYNLRNFNLELQLFDGNSVSFVNTNTFSSSPNWWSYKQGKTIKLDGTPFTKIYIK